MNEYRAPFPGTIHLPLTYHQKQGEHTVFCPGLELACQLPNMRVNFFFVLGSLG